MPKQVHFPIYAYLPLCETNRNSQSWNFWVSLWAALDLWSLRRKQRKTMERYKISALKMFMLQQIVSLKHLGKWYNGLKHTFYLPLLLTLYVSLGLHHSGWPGSIIQSHSEHMNRLTALHAQQNRTKYLPYKCPDRVRCLIHSAVGKLGNWSMLPDLKKKYCTLKLFHDFPPKLIDDWNH